MEPRIAYATAADGTHIAYAVSGSGPVLISVPAPPDNHVQLEWGDPERRRSIEHLSHYRTLVRFDGRGTGLSDRDIAGFSLEARVSDLEAVVAKLGAEKVSLLAGGHGNQTAIAYAAAHPERVERLVAVNPFVRGKDFMPLERLNLWREMLKADFRMFTDALSAETYGWGRAEGPRYAAFFRQCVTAETAIRIYDAMLGVDLQPHLEQIRCPVLVIRTESSGWAPEAAVRRFVASMPDARLALVGGSPVEGATDEMVGKMGEFFGEDWSEAPADATPAPAAASAQPEFRTILFTDVEGHTALVQRLGDAASRDVLREHERLTRSALQQHGGTELKTMGDGFMASFGSAQRAIDCAVTLQRALTDLNRDSAAGDPRWESLRVRVGVNAGEPIAEDGDLFGAAVITASRIASSAAGGEILVSNVVRELVAGKGYLFSDRGLQQFKGLDEPVRVWEVAWREAH
ncbi:MAG: adenylate/guanylate cyclase domain-containing protein [Chloroflexi bacterium]|nr:adenylate/guanylate cyclase domain-containing protein [Chloroflexota bacterium]